MNDWWGDEIAVLPALFHVRIEQAPHAESFFELRERERLHGLHRDLRGMAVGHVHEILRVAGVESSSSSHVQRAGCAALSFTVKRPSRSATSVVRRGSTRFIPFG